MGEDHQKEQQSNGTSLALLISLTLAAGLYRNGFPAIYPFLQAEFEVSRAVMGLYTSFLYLVAAGLAVFSGWIADQLGAKRGILLGMGSLSLLIMMHALAPTYLLILALAALSGIGFSIISPGASKAVTDLFPATSRGTPMGLLFMGWSIGGVAGAALLPLFASHLGWRWAAVLMGGFMLITITIFFIYFRDRSEPSSEIEPGMRLASLREGFVDLLTNPQIRLLCLGALILGSVSGTLATHYTLFVHLDYQYTKAFAGVGFAFLHAGSILGRPAWGWINDRLLAGREDLGFLFINLMNAAAFLVFALIYRMPAVPAAGVILAITFVAGFSTRGWPGVLFSAVSKQANKAKAGMALGLALVFLRLGVTLAPPVFGYIADITGTYEVSWFLMSAFGLLSGIGFFLAGRQNAKKT